MKRKLVIILAVCILFTPLIFALSYYSTSLVYQYKVLGSSHNSTTVINSYTKLKDAIDTSETSIPKEEPENPATPPPISSTVIKDVSEQTGNSKVVYLTFDDGPDSKVTEDILNTLKYYNIKATFFVIGNQIKGKENMLKEIAEGGHSIGLHSWSHNYKYIYANNDNFINEMNMTFNEVKKVTGIETHVIRFPGGSIPHLSQDFLNKLHSLNYSIYDWNTTTGDGMYPHDTPELLFKNLTSYKVKNSSIIVLMHNRGNNVSTSKALPKIIEYYQKLGYKFEPITKSTPEYYFKFKKAQ